MRFKFVLFGFIFILFFSIEPKVSYGEVYVKNVDVFFGDLDVKVDGKEIRYHQNPFIHEGDFYVSLEDLSSGLDMDFYLNNDMVFLSSKGKLDKNSDISNQPLLFQGGYEIVAKKNILENIEDHIRSIDGKGPMYLNYDMKGQTKNITVGFDDTNIYLDGNKLSLDKDLLYYNGDIYIAIDSISPYLFITPNLSRDKTTLNIAANGVLLPDNLYKTDEALLSILKSRNYLLDLQRAELERKKYILEDLNLPYSKVSNIDSLEKYLNKHFGSIENLDWELKVTRQSNWIDLDITFPAKNNFNWYRLSRADVEGVIWNMYTSILNLYDEDILLSGSIANPNYTSNSTSSWKNYVTFYSRDNDIYFDFSKSRLAKDNKFNPGYLMEILNMDLSSYGGVDFRYETAMSGDSLQLTIHPDTKSFNDFHLERQIGYLRVLSTKIREMYPSLIVEGSIVYPDEKIRPLNFYIEENRIRSRDLLDKTEEYINARFSRFSYGSNDFSLKYSIYEKDLKNFRLTVVSDFSVEDEKWINGGEVVKSRLNSNVHNAISYIFSLWNANISTEVLDERGNIISEFDIFSENSSLVSATPESGEILEGSKVYLTTDTPNSNIYYTIDGSTPTTSSMLYRGSGIQIDRDTTIKAFSYTSTLGSGPVSTFEYTVKIDESLSSGLTDLKINTGNLSPAFDRQILNYTVDVDEDVFEIDITPTADNSEIKVNDIEVASGEKVSVDLFDGENDISISVKEKDKKTRYYTVVVNKEIGGVETNYSMNDLRFNTLFGLIFRGHINSNTVDDFTGYEIKLLVTTGKEIKTISLNSDGSFDFPTDTQITAFDKLFGFEYEVYDATGKMVLNEELAQ